MALPEVETFKDAQGKNFDEFIMKFKMKYQNLRLRNNLLNQLLISKLEGYPKAVAQALPKILREGNFDDLVEALRSKFKCNDSAVQMKAYMDLKRLRKTGDVTRYCLELERLTRDAYPDASEEELSRTRAGELVSQLTDWPEYLQLYTTMEIAPKGLAYEMVKTMAQRCERSKEVAAIMRNASEGRPRSRQEGGKRMAYHNDKPRCSQDGSSTTENTNNKEEPQKKTDKQKSVMKCYNCNKPGHLKKDCMLSKKRNTMENVRKPQQQSEPAKMFTASLKK
uniref:Zinc finger domain containing protein n=1 Tax=Haemonchus contortus TaxID=6289 RepID=W6NG55_HAECO